MSAFAKEWWLEMGMLTFTVSAYTVPSGQLVVTAHDMMPELMGVRLPSFQEKNIDLVDNVKRSILNHVTWLQAAVGNAKNAGHAGNAGTAGNVGTTIESISEHSGELRMTELGFPILPDPSAWRGRNKRVVEPLIRTYLSHHYKLASGGRCSHAPFHTLKESALTMVPREYLLRVDALQDPRNMAKEDIISFLDHLYDRQMMYGAEDAFWFSHYQDKHRELQQAVYPATQNKYQPAKKQRRKSTQKGKGKARGKGKGKAPVVVPDEVLIEGQNDRLNSLGPLNSGAGTPHEQPAVPEDSAAQVGATSVICPTLMNLHHDITTVEVIERSNEHLYSLGHLNPGAGIPPEQPAVLEYSAARLGPVICPTLINLRHDNTIAQTLTEKTIDPGIEESFMVNLGCVPPSLNFETGPGTSNHTNTTGYVPGAFNFDTGPETSYYNNTSEYTPRAFNFDAGPAYNATEYTPRVFAFDAGPSLIPAPKAPRKRKVHVTENLDNEGQKRKCTRTADDLAAEEASKYAVIEPRRRVGNRKYTLEA